MRAAIGRKAMVGVSDRMKGFCYRRIAGDEGGELSLLDDRVCDLVRFSEYARSVLS